MPYIYIYCNLIFKEKIRIYILLIYYYIYIILLIYRKGRAGRVQSGESYHLITRSEYNKLDLYPKPEIFKLLLDKAIIISKTLSDEKTCDFFNSMIDSPNESIIISSVNILKNLGILDDDENLTSLGKYVSYISLTPKLSKAIILSCIFQYVI